jgi:hypothetical protein
MSEQTGSKEDAVTNFDQPTDKLVKTALESLSEKLKFS